MLSATEFTAGALADAKPLSLMLPRTKYESTVLVGSLQDKPAAVVLDGGSPFIFFPSSENFSWRGLIIPDVMIEVDQESLFDPQSTTPRLGDIVRTSTQLAVCGKADGHFGRQGRVLLHDGLLPAGSEQSAGFSRWCVVIGAGADKRTLVEVDSKRKLEA